MRNGTVIVGGFIGILQAGGVTWDYIQYVLGFKKLGLRVIYVEDTRLYPIYQTGENDWNDSLPIIKNLENSMQLFGLQDSWIYRDEVSGSTFGMPINEFLEACKTAEWFVNISCSTVMREEYEKIPKRILIDTDPMFTQLQMISQQSFTKDNKGLVDLANAHNYHFTFGENIGRIDCRIPLVGMNWKPTRQPVVTEYWPKITTKTPAPFTTLMNWSAGKKLMYEGESWGQKDLEFHKIEKIPLEYERNLFEIVVNKTGQSLSENELKYFKTNKWEVKLPNEMAKTAIQYRSFIQNSFAEISVAKETYVKANTGWFSCRSACYLATGRPVITQDTGWTRNYISDIGLFGFKTSEDVHKAIDLILSDPKNHSDAARQIALSYFDSDVVLSNMLNEIDSAK